MPIQKTTLPSPSPLDAADPSHAAEAVRRRIRRRWERRRAATAGHTALSILSGRFRDMPRERRAATIADTNLCLTNRDFAERRYALVEKVGR